MNIKVKEIEQLLEIIPNYPKINIFHINDYSYNLAKILKNFSNKNDYEYDLFFTYNKEVNPTEALRLNINQPRYNKHSKLYDFIFISSDLSKIENIEIFFKKIYLICKNSAKIVLFLEENDFNLEQLLEKLNFVAFNYIDISDNYKILSFQKMHGWGLYDMS